MSLVSEALRKARQEARLRDAAARGIPIEIVTRHVGGGRGPSSLVAVIAIAAAGLGGAALTRWFLAHRGAPDPQSAATSSSLETASRGEHQPASPARPRPEATPALSSAASAAEPASASSPLAEATALHRLPANEGAVPPRGTDIAASASRTTSAAVHSGGGVASATTTLPGSGSAALAPASDRTGQPPISAHPGTRSADDGAAHSPRADGRSDGAAALESPPSPRHPPRGSTDGERSFKIEATLGGVTLHLDYIVHRANSPFAGINGEQVLTGSMIRGFTVEEITPDAVRLSGPGGVVVLRTR